MATVGDVLREVLPSGTVCLAGQAALSRLTISAVILRLRGGFADLGPGTLGLINLELLRLPPRGPSLSSVLAQRWSCVLLQLPDSKEGQFRSWRRR